MEVEITEGDIEYAERLLLPEGHSFNQERRAFIRCMESRDVVACPGSGKTTALLGKLLILARKMPLENGRGICVLTHTNVAMDEIKRWAGDAAESLFRYPSFFGTIQSFVNAFLAGPLFRTEFHKSIHSIDNDSHYVAIERRYRRDNALRGWLEHNGGLSKLCSYWLHPDDLSIGETLTTPIKNLRKNTPTYSSIHRIRHEVLKEGILSYNDAYSLALHYLWSQPHVAQVINGRFGMVFMDEAQDTDEHQFKVLDTLFCSEDTIVQRVGDPNQAIFHSHAHEVCCWQPRNPLHLSDTRRYGTSITNLLCSVRPDSDISLRPCESRVSNPTHIITFRDGEEPDVLAGFAALIQEFCIVQSSEHPFKAVGWIGKDNTEEGKLCIKHYLPTFEKFATFSNRRFSNLISYSAAAIQNAFVIGAKGFLDVVVHGIIHALNIEDIKNEATGRAFTPTSLQEYLSNKHPAIWEDFRTCLAAFYLCAINGVFRVQELHDQARAATKSVWALDSERVNSFVNSDTIDVHLSPKTAAPSNQYVSESGMVIDVDTVHAVKGETHTATLYLETHYQRRTDGARLIEFLKGNRPAHQLQKAYHVQNLKVAHVAFSRPTDLLAFACRSESIAGHEDELRRNGWVIQSVRELLDREELSGG